MEKAIESRFLSHSRVEIRQAPGGKKLIRGYALKYNTLSQVLYGEFKERIDPGALEGCDLSDVFSTLNHDENNLLGRTVSGTLKLRRDIVGLYYEIDPPKNGAGPHTLELVERGDITGSSFVFELDTNGDRWDQEGGSLVRTLLKIKRIYEVGPVVSPAYLDTSVTVAQRTLEAWKRSLKSPPQDVIPEAVKQARQQLEHLKFKYNIR